MEKDSLVEKYFEPREPYSVYISVQGAQAS